MRLANSTPDTPARDHAQDSTNHAEELLEALPDDLILTLARLHGQPSDVVEVVLSTLRYGSRTTLAGAKAIEGLVSDAEKGEHVTLTELGREVIAVCARDHGPNPDDERRAKEALASARQTWVDHKSADSTPGATTGHQRLRHCP